MDLKEAGFKWEVTLVDETPRAAEIKASLGTWICMFFALTSIRARDGFTEQELPPLHEFMVQVLPGVCQTPPDEIDGSMTEREEFLFEQGRAVEGGMELMQRLLRERGL